MTLKKKSKDPAPESIQTRKIREKLQKHWEGVEKRITPEALQRTSQEIHSWIARHAPFRISLKEKRIALFDGNQHVAKESRAVRLVAEKLRGEMQLISKAVESAFAAAGQQGKFYAKQ